jgi:hypothetical protein
LCLKQFTGLVREMPGRDATLDGRLGEYAGHYRQRLAELHIEAGPDGLTLYDYQPAWLAAIEPRDVDPPPSPVVLFAEDRGVVTGGPRRGERCEFIRDGSGAVAWLRWDGRLSARIGD